MSTRMAQAQRLRDYFDLQLRFADAVAARTGSALGDAVGRYTNLHRRFGLGRIGADPPARDWTRYVERLRSLASHEQRLDWTRDYFLLSPPEPSPPSRLGVGAFALDPMPRAGAFRIHFESDDVDGGVGPLSSKKIGRRRDELEELFTQLRYARPEAQEILGGSWLYNLEAYRRLFPPKYVDTAVNPRRNLRYDGTSSWGQFVDHRGQIRPELRDRFLVNLERLNPEALWEVFPLPALVARAPVAVFFEFYGAQAAPPAGAPSRW